MVKARLRNRAMACDIEVQRAKFKHWYKFGTHRETDDAFRKAFESGGVQWQTRIIEDEKLF